MESFSDRCRGDVTVLLDAVEDICPFPAAAQRLIALTNDERSPVEAIARTLASDPALATQVLRVANSAVFRRAGAENVADLRHAIVTIGLGALRTMAGAMAMLATFATGDELSLDLHARSAVCGSIAATAAPTSPAEERGLRFICGLLSEVGALACLAVDGPGYLELRRRTIGAGSPWTVDAEILRERLEVAHYGLPARAIGARLLRRHRLPENIARAIEAPPEQPPDAPLIHRVTAFARIAASVVIRARGGPDDALTARLRDAARSTSLFELETEDLVRRCVAAAVNAREALRAGRAPA